MWDAVIDGPSGSPPSRRASTCPGIGEPIYRFAPGAALLFADGLPLLFSEADQKLFRLDRLGGYVACRCDVGVHVDELVADLCDRGVASDDAADFVERLLCEWSRHRLLAVTFAADGTAPIFERTISLSNRAARIRCFDDGLAELVDAAFPSLERAALSPVATYDIYRSGRLAIITGPGKSSAVVPRHGAVPALKARLMHDLLGDIGERVALHAACLLRHGRALLLCGAPGAGKTTLALRLAASGFALASDDITLLDDRGCVEGVPFPAAVKTGAWKLVAPLRPDFASAAVHVRADGKRVRYLRPDSAPGGSMQAVGIVMLRRRRGAEPRINVIARTNALARLVSEAATPSSSLSADMLRSLIALVARARCVEIEYDAAAEAVELLTRLVDYDAA